MSDVLIIETTVGSADDARVLADALVAERLAACAQIVGPIESVYWWGGAVTGAREWLVRWKTTRSRAGPLVRRLRELHPYEVPEIVRLEPAGVDGPYAAWGPESVEEAPHPTAGDGRAARATDRKPRRG